MSRQSGAITINSRVLIAVLLAVMTPSAAIIWGASKIDSRVESIEKWIVANADTQIKLSKAEDDRKVLEQNQHRIMKKLGIDF